MWALYPSNRRLLRQVLHNQEMIMATLQDDSNKLDKLATDFAAFAADVRTLIADYQARTDPANQVLIDSIGSKIDALEAVLGTEDANAKASDPGPVSTTT